MRALVGVVDRALVTSKIMSSKRVVYEYLSDVACRGGPDPHLYGKNLA
jgi:hypothetical protein